MSKLAGLECLDVPGWTGRIGGPSGRHAKVTRSVWFNPVPWTIVALVFTWVMLMARQAPCWQTSLDHPPNMTGWLCYSDIPVLFRSKISIWSGTALFGNGAVGSADPQLEYPVLTGGLIWVARWLSGLFGATINPAADATQQMQAANMFWAVNAFLLFVCFCVLAWAHLQMGRDSASPHTDGVRTRAWDALFIAASPLVMLSGLINWDLFAVALTSLGLLFWARKHPVFAGCLIGLAAAAKFYPLALIAVFFLLCFRSGRLQAWAAFLGGTVVTWAAVNLPLMIANPSAWAFFWTYNANRGPDLGSIWYVLTLMGIPVTNVSLVESITLTVCAVAIVVLVIRAPRRPRVAQVALLVMVAFLVCNKVYSPQYVLWLLPIVVLARPVVFDLLIFTCSETLYYLAVWGFLDGVLGIGSGPDRLYWISVGMRVGVQIWLAARVVQDMWEPWGDPVRGPFIDDPIGGVLNHAPDAEWFLRGSARPAPTPVAAQS